MLVGGLEHEFLTFRILGKSSSQLTFHIFQRGSIHQPDPIVVTSRYLCEFSIARSILGGYFNPLVFWYRWDYLRSGDKNLILCRVSG